MTTTAGSPLSARDEARWLRRPPRHAVARVWHETVTVRGARFQARLRPCDDGGCVVTFPALPQLMTRGVTCEHARIKAHALVAGYLRELRARQSAAARPADQRQGTQLRAA